MQKDNQLVGLAGEHLVMADLLLRGIRVLPAAQGMVFDLVAIVDKNLVRLQVKTTRGKHSWKHRPGKSYLFHVKYRGKYNTKYYEVGDFDGYAFVVLDERLIGYMLYDEKLSRNNLSFRAKDEEYGKGRVSPYFDELTWESFIKDHYARNK